MKPTFILWLIPLFFQGACLTKTDMAKMENTLEEFSELHWQPLMKEMDKTPNEKKFQRRTAKTVKCRKSMMKTLPEECEEYRKKRKKRKRRFSYNR